MFRHVVVGGTFDHFHQGHRALLEQAFSLGQKITIGLTRPEFIHVKEFATTIEDFATRYQSVEHFAKQQGRGADVDIIPIADVYGSTLEDTSLEAIVVTEQSLAGAQRINAERLKRGLPALEVRLCPFVYDQTGEIISSTRIRAGLIDRFGLVYLDLFREPRLVAPAQIEAFHKPLGKVRPSLLKMETELPQVYVGDVVTRTAIEAGRPFTCAYIDGRSHRAVYDFPVPPPFQLVETNLTNDPGTLAVEVCRHIQTTGLRSNSIVFRLQGEEDLLAAPAVLLSPLGSYVYYGHPFDDGGVVTVKVTEEIKAKLVALLSL